MEDYLRIIHHNGHVTDVPIYLPNVDDPFERIGLRQSFITEAIKNISPHLLPGSEVFLILKSKYQDEY